MPLSRRRLLALAPAALLAGGLRSGRADGGDARRFLFVFARGGWDTSYVFHPAAAAHYQPADSHPATLGGLPLVDAPSRPSVRRYFERYANDTCIINGFEVRSVTHERCTRLVLTGVSQAEADDWPTLLAGHAAGFSLPGVVVSGPSYGAAHARAMVRLGESGQLASLLDGSALQDMDRPSRGLDPRAEAAVDAALRARAEAFAAGAAAGRQEGFARAWLEAADQLDLLRAPGDPVDLGTGSGEGYIGVPERARPALDALELGLTRVAVVEHAGLWDVGWDTHAGIEDQAAHHERLFDDLVALREDLAARPGPGGGSLAEAVTLVVFSEMGRSPSLNPTGGKDHWTFTSAMLCGAGVAGGQVLGGYDEAGMGLPVDPATGQPEAGGLALTSAHLGATVLALGGLDPEDFVPGAEPLAAALA